MTRIHPHTLVPSMGDTSSPCHLCGDRSGLCSCDEKLDPLGFDLSDTPAPGFTIHGVVRVFFNRAQEAPRVWSLSDPGYNWELTLAEVTILAPFRTVYNEAVKFDPARLGPPTAYLLSYDEVLVEVTGDHAVIKPKETP